MNKKINKAMIEDRKIPTKVKRNKRLIFRTDILKNIGTLIFQNIGKLGNRNVGKLEQQTSCLYNQLNVNINK
jgi:hypothetical protein